MLDEHKYSDGRPVMPIMRQSIKALETVNRSLNIETSARAAVLGLPVFKTLAIMCLILFVFSLSLNTARAGIEIKSKDYNGGHELDFARAADSKKPKLFWKSVEVQSRECTDTYDTATPCVALWADAVSERYYAENLSLPGYSRLRGSKPLHDPIPDHFFSDIVPTLAKEVSRYWGDQTYFDSNNDVARLMLFAYENCQLGAQCEAFEKSLKDKISLAYGGPTSYHLDRHDLGRLIIGLKVRRGADDLLPAIYDHIEQPGTPLCDICLIEIAKSFERKGDLKSKNLLNQYLKDREMKEDKNSSNQTRLFQQERLLEGEIAILPSNHAALIERKLAIIELKWFLTSAEEIMHEVRSTCQSFGMARKLPNYYLKKFESNRNRCMRHLAVILYNTSTSGSPQAVEAFELAKGLLGWDDDPLRIGRGESHYFAPFTGFVSGSDDLRIIFYAGLAGKDFDAANRLIMSDINLYNQYAFKANLRFKNGKKDSETRELYLSELNCKLAEIGCPTFGLGKGFWTSKEKRLPGPILAASGPIRAEILSQRAKTFKRWVSTNWELMAVPRE